MCIFTGPVAVAGTRIFARLEGDQQLLAYQMEFATAGDVAMVLPLPVRRERGEGAVRFIDLSAYDGFFDDLETMFPEPVAFGGPIERNASRSAPLVVHQVGAFEASFVPTVADFDRLDARFRLSREVWASLPQFRDYGFAVFKLSRKPPTILQRIGIGSPPVEQRKVHPMAFAFHTREPRAIFFPTVHVHDGSAPARARFDHDVYCQSARLPLGWQQASRPIDAYQSARSQGLLDEHTGCFKLQLKGELENEDVWVAPPAPRRATRGDAASLRFISWKPVIGGPLLNWEIVIANLLERQRSALEEAHRRYVDGWVGLSTVVWQFGRDGKLQALVIESDYDSEALVRELDAIGRAVELPPLEGGLNGTVELRCGFGPVPFTPVAGG